MAIKYFDSLILFSPNPSKLVSFYRSIGLPLEEENHGDGVVHYACELEKIHIAIYPSEQGVASNRGCGGASQIGFQVDNLNRIYEMVIRTGARSIVAPQERPWGMRAIVEDPDGRPVELNQAP